MSRKRARIAALEVLFQIESRDEVNTDILKNVCAESLTRNGVNADPDRQFVRELVEGTWSNQEEYNEAIESRSEGWPLHRIGRVEAAIMRMALHELHNMDTPSSVVINEAVELAKKYASERAASFVNGILGSLVTHICE